MFSFSEIFCRRFHFVHHTPVQLKSPSETKIHFSSLSSRSTLVNFLAFFQGRNMVYGLRAQTPKYDWAQGSEERAQGSGLRRMGSGIARLLRPNQGSDLLHGLKISYHTIFPHNKVCVHRISWPRYITYSCFRLAAVPVIRSPGCLTKTWYHILNLLIVEGTVI